MCQGWNTKCICLPVTLPKNRNIIAKSIDTLRQDLVKLKPAQAVAGFYHVIVTMTVKRVGNRLFLTKRLAKRQMVCFYKGPGQTLGKVCFASSDSKRCK